VELDALIERYHDALLVLTGGDAEPLKAMWSHEDDVTLSNPWGPTRRGTSDAVAGMEFAASNFRDGTPRSEPHERLALFVSDELALLVENEYWRMKVRGADEPSDVDLRVTSAFRREDGAWKVIHRHADPITRPNPAGVIGYQPDP